MVSRAVSDAAQKYGGDSAQPIYSVVFIGVAFGFVKFQASAGFTTNRQNPSLMSSLQKRKGLVADRCLAMRSIICFRQMLSWAIALCEACARVESLTDRRSWPLTVNEKERSRMTLYALLLCGIQATGEILRLWGDGGVDCFLYLPIARFLHSHPSVFGQFQHGALR